MENCLSQELARLKLATFKKKQWPAHWDRVTFSYYVYEVREPNEKLHDGSINVIP